MSVEEAFAKVLGRHASDEERQRLYRLRDALGLRDNDAFWSIVMALEYYDISGGNVNETKWSNVVRGRSLELRAPFLCTMARRENESGSAVALAYNGLHPYLPRHDSTRKARHGGFSVIEISPDALLRKERSACVGSTSGVVELRKQDAIRFRAMTTSLRSALTELAASFAEAVLDAIRRTSLDELVQSDGNGRSKVRSSPASTAPVTTPRAKKPARSNGRLPRRSPEEIAAAVSQVVALVKKHKEGLRAEQIRSKLGLQPKEMPRVLKEGMAKKVLKSKGQKRATTYFAT